MRTIYIKYIEISLLRSFFQSKKQVERSGRTVKTIKRLIRRAYREILCISKPLIKLGGTTKDKPFRPMLYRMNGFLDGKLNLK